MFQNFFAPYHRQKTKRTKPKPRHLSLLILILLLALAYFQNSFAVKNTFQLRPKILELFVCG